MPSTTNITQGLAINFKDQAWLVASAQFVNPGKGSAFTRCKLKNLKTGQVVEHTFKSSESVEVTDTVRSKCQYLYSDGNEYHFMNNENYEQFSLSKEEVGENSAKYLLDGTDCYALYIEGKPVSIQIPQKMEFTIIETTPGVKGDTATGGSKEATIDTGAIVKVPLFIKEGEKIIVNTESDEYVSKA